MSKRKILRRFAAVLLVLIVILASVCVWQRDNITAFIESYTMTDDDMVKRAEEDVRRVNTYLEDNKLQAVRDLTEAEQQALINDEITDTQAVMIMKDEITLDEAKQQKTQQTEQTTPQSTQTKPAKPQTNGQTQAKEPVDYDTQISNLVAQVYVLKARFTSSLKSLEATVNNAFYSLPPAERNTANKSRIIAEYTQSALDMQADCDNQMKNLLTELEAILKKAGRDTGIVSTIKTSYENEKKTTKAMYIKKYLD